jgi:hypothetical protein
MVQFYLEKCRTDDSGLKFLEIDRRAKGAAVPVVFSRA